MFHPCECQRLLPGCLRTTTANCVVPPSEGHHVEHLVCAVMGVHGCTACCRRYQAVPSKHLHSCHNGFPNELALQVAVSSIASQLAQARSLPNRMHNSSHTAEINRATSPGCLWLQVSDADVLNVIQKMTKQRRDSIEQYKSGGRTDLVEKEEQELKVLLGYLPAQLSKQEIETIVSDVVTELGATNIKQMGAVMKGVTAKVSGRADNKMVSDLVKAALQPQK